MEVKRDVIAAYAESARRDPAAHMFDLFVIYAAADADFVRGYLLPALNLPSPRVLLVDRLTPGASLVSEIERGVCLSRFTVAVLSPAYLEDRWVVFGEQLASHLSIDDVHVIPLRLSDGKFPLRLEARVALDFTDRRCWESEATRLREMLHTSAPAAEQIPCPYPGMRPFSTDDASWFFGSERAAPTRADNRTSKHFGPQQTTMLHFSASCSGWSTTDCSSSIARIGLEMRSRICHTRHSSRHGQHSESGSFRVGQMNNSDGESRPR